MSVISTIFIFLAVGNFLETDAHFPLLTVPPKGNFYHSQVFPRPFCTTCTKCNSYTVCRSPSRRDL